MSSDFVSFLQPDVSVIQAVAAGDSTNPFLTPEYSIARESLGSSIYAIGLRTEETLRSSCLAFLSRNPLRRSLDIPSVPDLLDGETFWEGLVELCGKLGVSRLQVDSYSSRMGRVPQLPGEVDRRSRCEHVLDLTVQSLAAGLSTQHRRNISRAEKAGLSIRRTRESSSWKQHVELVDASMERRAQRGEDVEFGSQALPSALLKFGSAELFQAVQGEQTLSSILVLRAKDGAYYQSAGTLPEGMKLGASPFLISQVAESLRQEGLRHFNLGGATMQNPGLYRFKTGFGTKAVMLESASFRLQSGGQHRFETVIRSCWTSVKDGWLNLRSGMRSNAALADTD